MCRQSVGVRGTEKEGTVQGQGGEYQAAVAAWKEGGGGRKAEGGGGAPAPAPAPPLELSSGKEGVSKGQPGFVLRSWPEK